MTIGNIFAIKLKVGRQTINRASKKCEGKGSSDQKEGRVEVVPQLRPENEEVQAPEAGIGTVTGCGA